MKRKHATFLLLVLLLAAIITGYSTDKHFGVELTIMENPKMYRNMGTWDIFMSETSKASSFVGCSLDAKIPSLKDTIATDICEIDYTREFSEKINEGGGVDISFNLINFGKNVRDSNYIFYNKASIDYDSRTGFVADWYLPFNRRSKRLKDETTTITIQIENDTIYTLTHADPTGGITPEGHTYRFCGDDIDRVSGRSKAIFTVSQIFDQNGRDDWAEMLYSLETPWNNNITDSLCYKLPVLSNITLGKETLERIREKAVRAQKRVLIEKKDSLIAKYASFGEDGVKYLNSVFDNLRERLKPNLDDAFTPNELYLLFELDYFVNELTVHYKDGTSKNIVHIAEYIVSVP
ncbi:MAG: hypothetical protein WCX48_09825 [Bacteroidales bacterium]